MKQKHTLQWLSAVTGRAKGLVGLLVVVQTVLSVSGIAFAFVLRRNINMAGDGDGFRAAFVLLAGVIAAQIALGAVGRFLSEYTTATIENRFKQRLFAALLTGNYGSVTAVHSGEWMNRLTSDTTVVAASITQIVPGLIGMLVRLVGALAALLHKNIQEADGALRIFMQERLESLLIVRSFSKESQAADRASHLMNHHKDARMKRSNFSNLCNIGFAGAMNGAYLLGIGFCGYGILNGTMSYGNLMAIMQLVGQVQSPFANLTGILPRYYAMIASAERLMEAEEFAPDGETALPEREILTFYRTKLTALRLEHASFTYQPPVRQEEQIPMPVVLKDIDLTIRKGEYVAFTGSSGCGKSTVLKLFMCLYPLDEGLRMMETGDGVQPLTAAWRSLFAYVPQGNQLLSGTIRDIVSFGDRDRAQDDANIYHALSIACAEEFVRKLENGLDTTLGEHGLGLSEGQMQRIAIARAIFSEHPILMLDEATSALDEATARQLLENLRRMTDRTVIMVTHRTDQIEFFDKELSFSKDGICVKERNTDE